MNRRLLGALVVALLLVVPGVALARLVVATITSHDSSGVLEVRLAFGKVLRVRHDDRTAHLVASNPWDFPPGPCKRVALQWNTAVRAGASLGTFSNLLESSERYHCDVAISAGDEGEDGVSPLYAIAPAP